MKTSRDLSGDRENNSTPPQHPPPHQEEATKTTMIFDDGLNIDNVEGASEENIKWAKRQFGIFRHIIVTSCFTGILLTVAVLLIILSNRKFRTIPNLFHVNLFISNLCIMTTGLVFEFPVLLVGKWPFADSACQINLPLRRMFFSMTLAHFALMALNRLFAICFTNRRCVVISKTPHVQKPRTLILRNKFLCSDFKNPHVQKPRTLILRHEFLQNAYFYHCFCWMSISNLTHRKSL